MFIKYVGPDAGGVTLAPTAGGLRIPHGEVVEVPDDIGQSLTAQATFVAENKPERPRRKPEAAAPDVEVSGSDGDST